MAASPFLGSSGGVVLPVIQLETTAPTEQGASDLNRNVFKSLSSLIEKQQAANGIGAGQRIEIKLIDAPRSVLTSGRTKTAAILVLLLCVLGTLAVCHLLEGLRPRPQEPVDELVDWDIAMAKPEPVDGDDERPRSRRPPTHVSSTSPGGASSERRRGRGRPRVRPGEVEGTPAGGDPLGDRRDGGPRRVRRARGRDPSRTGADGVRRHRWCSSPTSAGCSPGRRCSGVILLVILFIPIRRYTVGADLPISLEPYRVVIAVVLACWAAALAADPKLRWRETGFGTPILVLWVGDPRLDRGERRSCHGDPRSSSSRP